MRFAIILLGCDEVLEKYTVVNTEVGKKDEDIFCWICHTLSAAKMAFFIHIFLLLPP